MSTPIRVRTNSTTTGTGNYTITGSPFVGKLAVNETCFIHVSDTETAQWESGIGTLQADGSVARTMIEESSNPDNSKISWAAGTRKIVATMGVSGAGLGVGVNFTPVDLVDSDLIAIDASLSTLFRLTLTGNRTLGNPVNLFPGAKFQIFIRQDTTGGRLLDYATLWKFANRIPPVLTTRVNALDVLTVVYDGNTLVGAMSKDFG